LSVEIIRRKRLWQGKIRRLRSERELQTRRGQYGVSDFPGLKISMRRWCKWRTGGGGFLPGKGKRGDRKETLAFLGPRRKRRSSN